MNTTYRSKKQVTRLMAASSHTLSLLMSMLRVSLEAAWSMARVWLEYAYSESTAHSQRDYSSLSTRLRLTISLLLMLTLGSSSVWGQTLPFEVTTADDITNHSEKFYWIESAAAPIAAAPVPGGLAAGNNEQQNNERI